ncbi:MAG: hypothetical protein O7J95_08645 [Planctomycetota bacterium]|nr:hypothetical protein [Planctomycetota bacterium]
MTHRRRAGRSLLGREELEARLRRPDVGENGHRNGGEELGRLDALRQLRELASSGAIDIATRRGGINTHVHTSKSFSYFGSPSDAAWQAYVAGVAVLGINDHTTTAGHEEFREACGILGILALFSMEAVATWEEAEEAGQTVNDPDNPGRTYLTAKGVTRAFPGGCQGEKDLRRMNRALLERNREITRRLAAVVYTCLEVPGAIDFDDVLSLTPHGQPTERHIAEALARFLEATYPERERRHEAVAQFVAGEFGRAELEDPAAFQDFLRSRLIKAGRIAYVPESPEAFIPVERMVSLALDLGAIPTYPVLGDPVTPWEEDLEGLFDRLEALRIHAIEVIPDRNRRERLRSIVEVAAARHVPVFNGTEHNSRSAAPLVDRYFFDPEFRHHFERGARVVLGHQALRERGGDGYVREDGSLPPGDRRLHLEWVEAAGVGLDTEPRTAGEP